MPLDFPNPFNWYRLSIRNLPGVCLDVINDGTAHEQGKLQMAPVGNFSGQHWQFLPALDGSFCMRTMYTGTDMLLSAGDDDVRLTREPERDGKRWYLEHVYDHESAPFRLRLGLLAASNQCYLTPCPTPGWFNNQRLHAKTLGNPSEQQTEWTITIIGPISIPEFALSPPVTIPTTETSWTNVIGLSSGSGCSLLRSTSSLPDADPPQCPILGWSYKLAPNENKLHYLDAHTLQWGDCITQAVQEADQDSTRFDFSPWPSSTPDLDTSMLISYFESFKSKGTIIIDVSKGFSRPRMLKRNDDFKIATESNGATYSESPPTYLCKSLLFSHQAAEDGLSYIFFISKGSILTRVDGGLSPAIENDGKASFRLHEDLTNINVRMESVLRIGVEDPVPQSFTWIDKEYKRSENIPVQHLCHLGHGGQAVVDKVLCSGRVFARKQIRTTSRLPLQTAMKELEAIRKVQAHWHVIKIVGFYTQSNTLGVILHPAAECDLQTALECYSEADSDLFTGRMGYRDYKSRFFEYFGCLAHGLAYLHSKSIRHRDIKPRNILVTFDGPLYTDFGIAKDFSDSTSSTTAGPTAKTYEYCAPEVAFGEERGRSSDVFSLGCIFLELFTVLTDRGTFQDCRLRRRTGDDPSYHANMEKVNNWIDELIHGELSLAPMLYNSRVCLLFAVRGILNHDRKRRPSAADIWKLTTSSSLDMKEHSGNSEYRPRLCGACCFNQLQE